MVLLTAAERRSAFLPAIAPIRFVRPVQDLTPLSVVPRDLHLTYARTEFCSDCGQVPDLRNGYNLIIDIGCGHNLISGLMPCWACGYNFFKPKSALGYAESVALNLSSDAREAIRYA